MKIVNISIPHLIILALAIFRITRLIVQDTVLEKVRLRIWRNFPPTEGFGYLITCYWCTSFWISSLVVTCFIIIPIQTLAVGTVMALSAITGLIAAWLDK
jgi:Protein of unknown function (DUF1360)